MKMPVIRISNGTIEEIFNQRGTTFVTVTYREEQGNRREEQRVRLVIGPRTIILSRNGRSASVDDLRPGMIVDAAFSSAMTRSIPPQAAAYMIRIVRSPRRDEVTSGTILNVDRGGRSFTTISDRDFSSVIRFNVSDDTRIFDRFGRPTNVSGLRAGMRVRVRHANFMTASIPPQTTAFEVRVL